MLPDVSLYAVPAVILASWALAETFFFVRPAPDRSQWRTAVVWFLRPLAVWAVFSLVFRNFGAWGVGNPAAFPFFFESWHSGETLVQMARRLARSEAFWQWSLVVLLLDLLLLLVCRRITAEVMTPRATVAVLLCLTALNFVMPLAHDCLPDGAEDPLENKGSFLHAWFDSGCTMLYCMPHIKGKGHYLRHFESIQPRLEASIHGVTHPPGASLILYWSGKALGAAERTGRDRLRYALGTTLFSTLGVLAMFFLGRSLFASNQVGLIGAALWSVKPATLAFNTFSPDSTYSVFYILALAFSWRVVTSEARPWGSMLGLGVSLCLLAMVNFNWPMLVAVFGVFLLIHARRTSRPLSDWLVRGAAPVTLALLLLLWICVRYRFSYLRTFAFALEYHRDFYGSINTAWRWTLALAGGQIDLYVLSGSLCAGLFWRHAAGEMRRRPLSQPLVFLLVILGVQLVISAFVSNALKMETSRVWAWVTAVPLVLVARHIQESRSPGFLFVAAAALSLLQYYGMRLALFAMG